MKNIKIILKTWAIETNSFGFRGWFPKNPSNATQNDRKASSRTKSSLKKTPTMQKEPPKAGNTWLGMR